MVFDVEKAQTYEDAMGMIEEFNTFRSSGAICLLLANKCDKSSNIDLDVVAEYCKSHHIMFEKVSSGNNPTQVKKTFFEFLHGKSDSNILHSSKDHLRSPPDSS